MSVGVISVYWFLDYRLNFNVKMILSRKSQKSDWNGAWLASNIEFD